MKIKMDRPLIGLGGIPIVERDGKEVTGNSALATVLFYSKAGDPIRIASISRKLYDNGECEVEPKEVEMIENAIKQTDIYQNGIKALLINELVRCKDADKKPKEAKE